MSNTESEAGKQVGEGVHSGPFRSVIIGFARRVLSMLGIEDRNALVLEKERDLVESFFCKFDPTHILFKDFSNVVGRRCGYYTQQTLSLQELGDVYTELDNYSQTFWNWIRALSPNFEHGMSDVVGTFGKMDGLIAEAQNPLQIKQRIIGMSLFILRGFNPINIVAGKDQKDDILLLTIARDTLSALLDLEDTDATISDHEDKRYISYAYIKSIGISARNFAESYLIASKEAAD